jgi:hypothetical protein
VLGNQFDPRVLEVLPKSQHLSGGAGASAAAGTGKGTKRIHTAIDNETRRTFEAGSSVRETYQRYLNWLSAGRFDPNIGIFTKESRNYLAGFPMSQGYFEYILFMQYGYAFKIEQRDELALMTYTDTPFACPHFFRRTDEGWQMDIVAEVRLAPDVIGGIYSWYLRMADDPFIDRFADKLIHIKGYNRLIDGDNRPLPIRNPAPRPG